MSANTSARPSDVTWQASDVLNRVSMETMRRNNIAQRLAGSTAPVAAADMEALQQFGANLKAAGWPRTGTVNRDKDEDWTELIKALNRLLELETQR